MGKLQITLPFVKMLKQSPIYNKFMKEVLSKERKLRKEGSIVETRSCNAIFHRKLLQRRMT